MRRTRQYRFICAVAGGKFLASRRKDGPWPRFSTAIGEALKFKSEEDAVAWLRENGGPRVWLERHSMTLRHS